MKRTPLVRRTPLVAKVGLSASPALSRWTGRLARKEPSDSPETPRTPGRVEASPAFRRTVTRRPCAACRTTSQKRDAHHLVPQQELRRYVSSLRLPDAEARPLLRRLLSDPRNGVSLCRPCHERVEARTVLLFVIPSEALEFARELGEWAVIRLERAVARRIA